MNHSMSLVDWLVIVAAILVVIGIAVGMNLWTMRVYKRHRRIVADNDACFRETARMLGLQFMASPYYEHPVVGRIPSFGTVRGKIDGVEVALKIADDYACDGPRLFWTELRAVLPKGHVLTLPGNPSFRLEQRAKTLVLTPIIQEKGSSQSYLYRLESDPGKLAALLRELTATARGQME